VLILILILIQQTDIIRVIYTRPNNGEIDIVTRQRLTNERKRYAFNSMARNYEFIF